MRKLDSKHEVWYFGEFDTLSALIDQLAIHVASLEDESSITNIDISGGDALNLWTATLVVYPESNY